MLVAMMGIGVVRVFVSRRRVRMRVDMRLAVVDAGRVNVLVMHVMRMAVLVLKSSVKVTVTMALRKVQPNAGRHECAGEAEIHSYLLPQQHYRNQRTGEWCNREISGRSGRAQLT